MGYLVLMVPGASCGSMQALGFVKSVLAGTSRMNTCLQIAQCRRGPSPARPRPVTDESQPIAHESTGSPSGSTMRGLSAGCAGKCQ